MLLIIVDVVSNESMFYVCSSRNFQLLSFGEEAEEDEREVAEVAEVIQLSPVFSVADATFSFRYTSLLTSYLSVEESLTSVSCSRVSS